MKNILFIITLILSFTTLAEKERSNYWEIISSELDTTIAEGFCQVKIVVEDIRNDNKLKDVSINLNRTTYLGKTNSEGQFESTFKSGQVRLCADTPQGSSFVANYPFKSQFIYVIKIKMKKKEIVISTPSHAVKKPVIYLYPTTRQKINIKLEPKGEFVFTYPHYPANGWSVIAQPNGQLNYNDRLYNYLFWEAESTVISEISVDNGFIVNSDTVVPFLEHTLTKVGLSEIEQADFITYWAPQLEQSSLNFIHFEFNEGYSKYISEMTITPKPQSLIRVFMTYKPVNETYNIEQQRIPSYQREGFTVVEWGGSQL